MSRAALERRLAELVGQLRELRRELSIVDDQLAHLEADAADARLRSLLSETPLAEREHRDAARHAAAMRRQQRELRDAISALEHVQDELLDRLVAAS